jgi:hypothetical protein
MAEVLPPALKAQMDKVKPALEAYLVAGRSALTALKSGADSSADIAAFDEKFTYLAEANEKLGDDLLKWADKAKVESFDPARSCGPGGHPWARRFQGSTTRSARSSSASTCSSSPPRRLDRQGT